MFIDFKNVYESQRLDLSPSSGEFRFDPLGSFERINATFG